jgi:hypothetical protein
MRCHFGLQYTYWKGRTQGEDGDATTVRQWTPFTPFTVQEQV